MTYHALNSVLRRLGQRVGVDGGLHKFRQSMAVEYLPAGGRLETLKNTLGHTTYDSGASRGRRPAGGAATPGRPAAPRTGRRTPAAAHLLCRLIRNVGAAAGPGVMLRTLLAVPGDFL